MDKAYKKTVLLTGAGFTANFGGFLAKEMWTKIFNNKKLDSAPELKMKLKENLDFEKIYSEILQGSGQVHPQERQIFIDCLNEAYIMMDNAIRDLNEKALGIQLSKVKDFLGQFSGSTVEPGLCFTLNQDLFMERHVGWQPLGPNEMRFKSNSGVIDQKDLDSNEPKTLPDEKKLEKFKNDINERYYYIKLHGSQRWIAPDLRDAKILGINKPNAIEHIHLLKWYFELFKTALNRPDVKLVVIGYSFQDEHINKLITDAVNSFGLKLYVINTENIENFSFNLTHKYPRNTGINENDTSKAPIWKAIAGYFPYELKSIFPVSEPTSIKARELYESIGFQYLR